MSYLCNNYQYRLMKENFQTDIMYLAMFNTKKNYLQTIEKPKQLLYIAKLQYIKQNFIFQLNYINNYGKVQRNKDKKNNTLYL